MRLLKRVIVVVLLGVILFMVRDDIRYVYQLIKYGDKPSALALSSYKAVIQQNQSQELRVTFRFDLLRRRQDAFRRY